MSSSTRSHRASQLAAMVALALLASACTTVVRSGPAAAIAPQLSVERFLQASNARDLEGMGRIFGTADGAALETGSTFGCFFKKIGSWFGGNACITRQDVEIRMDAISSVLRHEDYRIVREEMVAGRTSPTTRVLVTMTVQGRTVTEVPFEVVQAGDGRWLVQNVNLQMVMGR